MGLEYIAALPKFRVSILCDGLPLAVLSWACALTSASSVARAPLRFLMDIEDNAEVLFLMRAASPLLSRFCVQSGYFPFVEARRPS